MRGASAESLATLIGTLRSSVQSGADAQRIGEDLFGVAEVLRREPGLRRVTTDASIAPEAKGNLAREVFGEQLDSASLEVVARAASLRWASSRDLGDALEHLGVVAVVLGADNAGHADALEHELFAFGRIVTENPELRDALSDPARSTKDKRALIRGLLDGRATPAAIRLAEQSVDSTHRTVAVAIEAYQKIAADHRNRLVGTVRVARELADADRQRLEDTLSGQYGRPVHLNVVVDPKVIGGMKVELGGDVIDGTVASRLDDARRRLAG